MQKLSILLFGIFLIPFLSFSQELNLKEIMKGQDFTGYWPSNPEWSPDSKSIIFTWKQEGDSSLGKYRYFIENNQIEHLVDSEYSFLPRGGIYNRSMDKCLFSRNGDLHIYYPQEDYTEQITKTKANEYSARFNFDETAVIYTKGGELYKWDLFDGSTVQLSNFDALEKNEKEKTAMNLHLETEQLELISILRERKDKRETALKAYEEGQDKYPPPFEQKVGSISKMTLSADERFILFYQSLASSDKLTEVPNYVTEDGFTSSKKARVKVGSDTKSDEIWILSLDSGKYTKVDFSELPDYSKIPNYYSEYNREDSSYAPKIRCHGPYESDNGEHIVFLLKAQDNKSRWIAKIDLKDARVECLVYERDETWIGGPGISGWNSNSGTIGFLPESNSFYYQSEKTGYSHLYLYNMDNGKKRALTTGNWEVLNARPSKDGKFFYLEASAEDPFNTSLYKLSIEPNSAIEKMSNMEGANRFVLSPDNKHFIITHSTSNSPWELYVKKNKKNSKSERITHSTSVSFDEYEWRIPEIIKFKAADGEDVPARIYKPATTKKNGKAVIFVHGAGYLHNVHNWWSNYYREFMFHNLLADKGYTVLDIDYRGSAGYGRDWRTAIYRNMGGKDLSDQIDGAKYLVQEEDIKNDKIGIYGGSYGGFITLMALFNHPGTFLCGAALRSVTDWAHYNHPYTANILNTPVLDSIAYRRSSPIYYAEGLEDDLLLCHGVLDNNVQFQDVVRLSQRLIELEKENWEMALFPLEAHGFKEASSWFDEYRRILKLFEEEL